MTLRELMGNGAPEVEVTGLAYSSGSVSEGALFFCVRGFTSDGHDYAPDAVQRGAAALVCERTLGLGVPEILVEDARAAMGPAAARFYGHPTSRLRVAGITGTNGKTTTAFLIRDVLERAGVQTGLMGTVKRVVGGKEEAAERTTPEAIDIQATFARMLEAGDRACAMEVSSHALELGRAEGIEFAVKVFTNLTQDHLDFHDDMEAYYLAKRRLFDRPGPAVVNADDAYGRRLADELGDAVTFSVQSVVDSRESIGTADYLARDVSFDVAGATFTVHTPDGPVAMTTRLPGLFNVSNTLAAFAAARTMGVEADIAVAALAESGRVPGRFEPVEEGQPFAVLVDYAHTPDSLENVLRAARELCRGRLHVVFGAGGDRDRAKRPLMGRAAAEHADHVLVTSDNPRSEDPDSIVDQVMQGAGPGAEREVDRRRAIAAALAAAEEGDVVVIAGKGHEQGQEFESGRKEPFDDAEVAREALRARGVKELRATWIAEAAGASLVAGDPTATGATRAAIDTREVGAGDLFVGLRGEQADGGRFAAEALAAGAWGVLVASEHAERAAAEGRGVVMAAPDPLAALQSLARAWRRELSARVIGVTGSTGKTSTKDIAAAMLGSRVSTHANRENLNTEIGLPLTILEAPPGTEVMVLEMAMRGEGQIAELTAIAEPDVGVIVNVGPVHLELLGTVERVAAAKAELIRDLAPGATCVVPAAEPLLESHLRGDLETITFGPGGAVNLLSLEGGRAEIEARGEILHLELSYSEPHNLLNTLAAVAAALAVGVRPAGRVEPAFSSMRGEVVELAGGVTVVNDCYNANPMSMRAALKHLAETPATRRVAVLGTMAELGPGSAGFHREIGMEAGELGIDVLITVGPRAAGYAEEFDGESYATAEPEEAGALLSEIAMPGDRVLIKGSRSVGLEKVLG